MADITQFPRTENDPYDFMVGPFETYRCVIEGRAIPKLTAFRDGPDNISLVLDDRLSIIVPKEYARSVAWLVANALAIGEGYSHLGAGTKEMPFAPVCGKLETPSQ